MENKALFLIASTALLLSACNMETLSKNPPKTDNTIKTVAPSEIKLDDHQACTKKGYALGKMEDPLTYKYYKCRAKLLKEKTESSSSNIFTKLSPAMQKQQELQTQELKHFEEKAEAAYKAQIRARDIARTKWEEDAAKMLDKHENDHHHQCTQKGYYPTKMENPLTEAYYDCRAVLAQQVITPPPPETSYPPTQLPKVVQEYYRNADQAKEAFNAKDYQDHYTCMDKGLFPGKFQNPKTAAYLECRANLARSGLGNMVSDIFKEDAASARKEAEEHNACHIRHYKKGTQAYKLCREAYVEYKACKQTVEPQISQRKSRDRRDCSEKASLEYPSYLSRSNTRVLVKVDDTGEEIRTTAIESAKYTPGELTKARNGASAICLNERQSDLEQFKLQLGYKCEQIMTNLPQP